MNIFNVDKIDLLYLIPVLLGSLFFVYLNYRKSKSFNSIKLSLMRNYKYSLGVFRIKYIFLLISILLLFISVLRPSWGENMKTVESNGADVVFTLDVSQSMKALDVGDGKSDRLTLAKNMITNFASAHPENRYGLIIFAGEAFVSTPLTNDTEAFLTFLDGISYNDIGKQGTDLDAALEASIDRFYSEQDKNHGRSIVLISDGGEDSASNISKFSKIAKKLNIKVFTIGIGSTKGVPIPEGQDFFGRISYKQYKGKTVLTKLNEDPLREIAKKTGGEYFHAKNKNDLEKISDKLIMIGETSIKTREKSGLEDRYQYFLFPGFLFFILYFLISNFPFFIDFFKDISIKNLGKFRMLLFVFILLSLSGCSTSDMGFRYYNTKGNEDYNKSYLNEAKEEYQRASDFSDDLRYVSDNNYAVVFYKEKKYNKNIDKIKNTIKNYCVDKENKYCDILNYNLGNYYYRLGEKEKDEKQVDLWKKAVDAYKEDLKINKDDKDAQENIDFILDKIKENNKNNSEKSNSKDNQKEDENKSNDSGTKNGEEKNSDNSQGGDDKQSGNKSGDEKNEDGQSGKSKEESGDKTNPGETGDGQSTSNQDFDEKTNQQIENYMNNLQDQEKNNQKYFQANPNGSQENADPFGDFFSNSMFDDPFFNNFFGNNTSKNSFSDNEPSNGVDW